jgi:serine/threonine protein kinase
MNELRQDHIVRFLAGYSRGDPGKEDYFLMFEWADGVNLRWLWNDTTIRPRLTNGLAKAAIKQIMGLAMALCRAHCPETRDNHGLANLLFRHGDLKPENILWFKDGTQLGTLKIADFGLTKEDNVTTPFRTNSTSPDSGTVRYQPPEEELDKAAASRKQGRGGLLHMQTGPATDERPRKRSRLYDIWGMGCITLEFLVWLLYGSETLRQFNDSFKNAWGHDPFYQVDPVNRDVATVHDIAVKWMDHMAEDPVCKPKVTALGDLLQLVRGSLLVVKLPPNRGASWDVSARQPSLAVALRGEHSVPSPSATVDLPLLNNSDRNPNISARPDIVVSKGDEDDVHQEPKAATPPKPTHVASAPIGYGPFRVLTPKFLERMQKIYQTSEPTYWFTDVPNRLSSPETEDSQPYRGSFITANTYTWRSGVPTAKSTQRVRPISLALSLLTPWGSLVMLCPLPQ